MSVFYDNFQALCKKHGTTPTAVGRELGIKQQTVSLWKTRGSTPNARTIRRIADYFKVSVGALFDYDDIGYYYSRGIVQDKELLDYLNRVDYLNRDKELLDYLNHLMERLDGMNKVAVVHFAESLVSDSPQPVGSRSN